MQPVQTLVTLFQQSQQIRFDLCRELRRDRIPQRRAPRRIAPDVELALYRIAQESLSNARRHAGATQVEVTLVFGPQQVRLTVADDGAGFTLPADLSSLARSGHFGLMSMRERAQLAGAHLDLETAPDQGTSVTVTAFI